MAARSLLAGAAAALLALAAAAPAVADDCEALLRGGLYDLERSSPRDDLERARRWLVDGAGPDAATARARAEALGIDPALFWLGVGAIRSEPDWGAWVEALRRTDLSRLQMAPRLRQVASATSAALRTALARCTGRPGAHLWTETTDDPSVFRIHVRHVGSDGQPRARLEHLVALEGEHAAPVECDPELPDPARRTLFRRLPRVPERLVSRCRREDPAVPVVVRLAASGSESEARVAPWLAPQVAPLERAVPAIACGRGAGGATDASTLALRVACTGENGQQTRRTRALPGWNRAAEAQASCPSPDLPGDARAALRVRCEGDADGTVYVALSGALRAHAGWRMRGCRAGSKKAGHCPARAEVRGEATSALFVDLNSHHCAFAEVREARGRGTPANNGSRDFGPTRFAPSFVSLRRPDGSALPLDAGAPVPLDAPGPWQLVVGAPGEAMPEGWRFAADRNEHSGAFEFREAVRVRILQAREDGSCGEPQR